MYIPKNINELLDERIQFCESVLSAKDKIPNSTDKESLIAKFDVELKNFKKLKELLTLIVDPGVFGHLALGFYKYKETRV